jgi:hypothetical protein
MAAACEKYCQWLSPWIASRSLLNRFETPCWFSNLQTWTYKPQNRQDISAFALTSPARSIASRLRAARVAFAQVRHDRELFASAGIGPGDAYMALWSFLIETRNSWQGAKEPERKDIFRREYVEVLKAILRPRLQVVKVRTDSDTVREPEEMAKALAKALTPEELELLDKVALKLVSAPDTIDGKAEEPLPAKRGRPPKRP